MKRDMNLVRELLLKLEALPLPPGVLATIYPSDPALAVDGFSADDIYHHLRMIVDGGFLQVHRSGFAASGQLLFCGISWAGRDFLDSVRDPKIWEKTKKGAEAAGGFTADLLKDLAKGFVKKQIEEYTGVKL